MRIAEPGGRGVVSSRVYAFQRDIDRVGPVGHRSYIFNVVTGKEKRRVRGYIIAIREAIHIGHSRGAVWLWGCGWDPPACCLGCQSVSGLTFSQCVTLRQCFV